MLPPDFIIKKLKSLTEEGVKISDIEKSVGIPKNNLSGIINLKRPFPQKWIAPLEGYINGKRKEWKFQTNYVFGIIWANEDGTSREPTYDELKAAYLKLANQRTNAPPNTEEKQKDRESGAKDSGAEIKPKSLDELKKMCPQGLDMYERAEWVSKNRVKYGI